MNLETTDVLKLHEQLTDLRNEIVGVQQRLTELLETVDGVRAEVRKEIHH